MVGRYVRNIIIMLLCMFTIGLFSITIELSEGGKVEAKIVEISKSQVAVESNNCLLFIAKPLIKSIKNDGEEITLKILSQQSYPDIDFAIYDNIIEIDENYIYNQRLTEFIQMNVKDVRTEVDNFVQLKNGDIYTGDIQYEKPFLFSPYILVNKKHKYKVKDVDKYQTEDGYFCTVPMALSGDVFAKRIEKGRIDLYSSEVTYNHMNTMGFMITMRYDYF